jgi:hypothetical protein
MSSWWSIITLLALVGLFPLVDIRLRNFSRQRARRRFGRRLGAKLDV